MRLGTPSEGYAQARCRYNGSAFALYYPYYYVNRHGVLG